MFAPATMIAPANAQTAPAMMAMCQSSLIAQYLIPGHGTFCCGVVAVQCSAQGRRAIRNVPARIRKPRFRNLLVFKDLLRHGFDSRKMSMEGLEIPARIAEMRPKPRPETPGSFSR